MNKKIGLLFICILLLSVFVIADTPEKDVEVLCFDEIHSITQHSITCRILALKNTQYTPKLNITSDPSSTNHRLYVQQKDRNYNKQFFCTNSYPIGNNSNVCTTYDFTLIEKEYYKWTEFPSEAKGLYPKIHSSKNKISLKQNEVLYLKYTWNTYIDKHWGSEGSWATNPGSWWDVSFLKRKGIVITDSADNKTLINYTLQLNIAYEADMATDCGDIRFVSNNSIDELPYWIEECGDTTVRAWVMVDSIPQNGQTTIGMYFENIVASTTGDPEGAFRFYDNFNDGSVDASKWKEVLVGAHPSAEEEEGRLKIPAAQVANENAIYLTAYYNASTFKIDLVNWNRTQYGPMLMGVREDEPSVGQEEDINGADSKRFEGTGVGALLFEKVATTSFGSVSAQFNQRYNWSMSMDQTGNFTWWQDYTNMIESGIPTQSDQQNLTFWAGDTSGHGTEWQAIDEIRIRDFIYPEPTVTYEASEAQGPTVRVLTQSPANETSTALTDVLFTCNSTALDEGQVDNSTLYFWTDETTLYLKNESSNYAAETISANYTSLLTFPDNTYVWNCLVSGNESTGIDWGTNLTFIVNTAPPTIDIVSPTNFNVYNMNETLSLDFNVEDTDGIDTCWIDYNNTLLEIMSCDNITFKPSNLDNTIIFYTNDSLGNINSETLYFHGYSIENYTLPVNNDTLEGTTYNLAINIFGNSSIAGYFHYNGTQFGSTHSSNAESQSYSFELLNPKLDYLADDDTVFYNVSVLNNYWNFTITGEESTTNLDVDFFTHKIALHDCSDINDVKTVNMSFTDEDTLEGISTDVESVFRIYPEVSTINRTYTFDSTSVTEQNVCIYPAWANYTSDIIIDYSAAGYESRIHYDFDLALNNITTDIGLSLSLLNSSSATTVYLKVLNGDNDPLNNMIIQIERYYPISGSYSLISSLRTDQFGYAVASLTQDSTDYRFIIQTESGTEVFRTDRMKIICLTTPCTKTFIVSEYTSPFDPFRPIDDFIHSLAYNNNTERAELTWADAGGNTELMRLLVQQVNTSGMITICNDTSSSLASSLTCSVSFLNGSFKATAFRTIDGTESTLDWITFSVGKTGKAVFGDVGLWLGLLIVITVGMIFIYNPTAQIVAIVCSVIFVNWIFLVDMRLNAIMAVVGIGLYIMARLKT